LDKIFRFASFEADRDRHLLRHGNRRLKVERIPLELLFLLLEEQGKLVTREQIVDRLWGSDLLLDTERSINTAIRKVRRALHDRPRHARFIETVIGRGYRFVGSFHEDPGKIPILASGAIKQNGRSSATQALDGVTLRDFVLEVNCGSPTVTCEVVADGVSLGRLPLVELGMPSDIKLPLRPEDRLLMKLLGVRVSLTPSATQTLHALCISLLQRGIRTHLKEVLPLEVPATTAPGAGRPGVLRRQKSFAARTH